MDERLYQYDGEGNVSRIMDTNNQYIAFGWDQGRKMTRYRYVDVDNTYYYNESGLVSKLVKSDGSSIEYFYDDGQLEYEEYRNAAGNVARLHKFFYDDDGIVRYLMTTVYPSYGEYFSDVYAYVYDGSGNITDLVCMKKNMRTQGSYFGAVHSVHYEYDAYGRIVSETNVSGEDIIDYNPIKYKGYYYENDTKMYRLDSRYYDPAIGRFINADNISLLTETPTALTDKNLYSYCDNTPVMRKDSDGEIWNFVIGAAVSGVVSAGFEAANQIISNGKVTDWGAVGKSFAVGAVSSVFKSAKLIAGISFVADCAYTAYKTKGSTSEKIKSGLTAGAISAGLSLVGGATTKKLLSPASSKYKTTKSLRSKVKKERLNRSHWTRKGLESYLGGRVTMFYSMGKKLHSTYYSKGRKRK